MGGPHPRFIGLRFLTAEQFDFHRRRRADELERQRLMIVLRTDLARLSEAKHWPPPTSPSNSNLISNPNAALKKHKETPLRKLDNPAFLLYKPKDKKLVTEEEWSCALCKVRNNSQRSWREHLQGRKHKANEAALIAEIKSNSNSNSKSLPKQENPPSEKQKESLKFWCEACGVGTHSLDVMSDHKKGKRHVRSVKKEVAVVC
ncbi:Zinc finger RNA-binding protein [Linum grandiflorum]